MFHLLENLLVNLEKNVEGLELIADVSCDEVGIPAKGARVRLRVIPEWKVDLSGTFRENEAAAAEDPRPVGDKGNLLQLENGNCFMSLLVAERTFYIDKNMWKNDLKCSRMQRSS